MRRLIISLDKFQRWRLKHFSERQFIYALSILIGLLSGIAAILLKHGIHFAEKLLTDDFYLVGRISYKYIAYPMIGILITTLFVKYIVKEDIGHGISKILHSISKRKGRIKLHNTFTSIVASTITIGFGNSVGAEAPIVLTGSSIGSNMASLFRLNYRQMTLMIGCGAAGAVAGIFKAPLAGVLFAIEVLMLDLTMVSILPLLLSAITAASIAYFFMGSAHLFNFAVNSPFDINDIGWYLLLGVACGGISTCFTRSVIYIESKYAKLPKTIHRIVIGGAMLGVIVFLFPSIWGEGYFTINELLNGKGEGLLEVSLFKDISDSRIALIALLSTLIVLKIIATAATTGAGGIGGIFAPTLFIGALTGYLIALVINFNSPSVSAINFALVGMAGMMGGVMHAPMTAIFLIAEITGGYGLFIPLMVTSALSHLTSMPFEPHSIYHKHLANKGELITHDKDKAALTLLKIKDVIETDLCTIDVKAKLADLVKVISSSKRNIFPVVDSENNFKGLVFLDDIREIMFNREIYDSTYVIDIMIVPDSTISAEEKMDSVMKKFKKTGAWNLPVTRHGKYVGFISKSRIFVAYRDMLVNLSEENM